jgi:hypothetical protein
MEITFLKSAFNEIVATVGAKKAETGAILLGDRKDFVVQKIIFDPFGSTSSSAYDPDTEFLNKVIKKEWDNNKLALIGFVHSHPRGYDRLSGDYGNNTGDVGYLKAIFKAIPALDKFLVPIVFSTFDQGSFKLIPFVAWADNVEGYHAFGYNILDDHKYAESEQYTTKIITERAREYKRLVKRK